MFIITELFANSKYKYTILFPQLYLYSLEDQLAASWYCEAYGMVLQATTPQLVGA